MTQEVTDANIAEVLKDNEKALIIFSAPWCGPCRMMVPVLDLIASANPDKFVGKINIDVSPETSVEYGINSVPTIMLFKNGELIEKKIGARSKKELQALLDSL